ncbi:MAG: translation initiation factor IF-2, partial [Elusimicrobia bacterium]|nr:translation initiation factor IF-2 [Elusimicrobiota bacterium]
VFLDTPGHEAFTAMRARGAKATDIVVLVVSAADGVMPQTVEAIDHAKAADVPIVVAVNKIDLPTANVPKIKQELSQYGLLGEDWGGKTIMVEVSAKKRINLDKLLEMILLEAELLEIKANPDRPAIGAILEARMDAKKGNVATMLVQNGTLKQGDPFVVGLSYGRVRALVNDRGERVQAAPPSTPIELIGISGTTPQAGDILSVVSDERQAKDIAEKRQLIHREQTLAHQKHISLLAIKSKGVKELKIVLKTDVQGSLQALKDSLEKTTASLEISLKVIHAGIGSVNESDILLAKASDAVILGFHVDIEARAQEEADRSGVEIRIYSIIYDLIADVKAAMEGLLEPEIVEVVTGKLEVRQIFQMKGGKIAGCMVSEGKVQRGSQIRVLRSGKAIFQGNIASLKHFKEDVKEVEKGFECGLMVDNFKDFLPNDILEVIVKEKRTRRLEPAL